MLRAVLLDRDGTINRSPVGKRYVDRAEDFHLLEGVGQAIADLNRCGVRVFVVTNQRGLATGALSLDDLTAIHLQMARELACFGAHIDQIYVCGHDIDDCNCRKPAPGLLNQAIHEAHLERDEVVMIGNSGTDLQAASAAGVVGILVGEGGEFDVRPMLWEVVRELLLKIDPDGAGKKSLRHDG